MSIRYRHHPDPDLSPNASPIEGEVQNLGELEALVLLGSVGPSDEVALDGKSFKKAGKTAELREPLRQRYGEPPSLVNRALWYSGGALVALIAAAVVISVASTVLEIVFVLALIVGVLWALRRILGRHRPPMAKSK